MKNRLSIIFLIALFITAAFSQDAIAQNKDELGSINFTSKNLNSRNVRLNKLLEKGPVLLNFLALWCVPCMKELPYINKINNDYKNLGLSVVTVNEDSPTDQSKVKPFIRQKRFKFEVVFDENKDIWNKFLILSLPTTILLNKNKEIVYSHTGYKPGDEEALNAAVESLLNKTNDN